MPVHVFQELKIAVQKWLLALQMKCPYMYLAIDIAEVVVLASFCHLGWEVEVWQRGAIELDASTSFALHKEVWLLHHRLHYHPQ